MKECPRCGLCADDSVSICPEDDGVLLAALDGPPLIDRKYQLRRVLGRGGMGTVYLALHVQLQKDFALKLILPQRAHDSEFLRRFRVEAEALGRLNHPSIVAVTDFGVDERHGGLPYLVMEYVPGDKLTTTVEEGPVPVDEAIPILRDVAAALDAAHHAGVLHRDLKPDNVILQRGPTGRLAKVLDFGLALLSHPSAVAAPPDRFKAVGTPEDVARPAASSEPQSTRFGVIVGTAAYLAPEAIRARHETSSDIYSLAVIAYEMLTGRRPFTGSHEELIEQHLSLMPARPSSVCPGLPAELDAPLLQALDKDPARRPKQARELVARLENAWVQSRRRSWRAREIPRRAGVAAGLALLFVYLCLLAPRAPAVRLLEDLVLDGWFYLTPATPIDSRIAIVMVPDAFWTPAGLDDAEAFASGLERLYDAGALVVLVDLILPERFGASAGFARSVLRHREQIALSAAVTEGGLLRGSECISGFIAASLTPAEAADLFAVASLDEEPDARVRRYALQYRHADGSTRPSLAARGWQLAGGVLGGASDFRPDFSGDWRSGVVEWPAIERLLAQRPRFFQHRMVLVGGTSELGDDVHRVPHPRSLPQYVPGVAIHAVALSALASGRAVRTFGGPLFYMALGLPAAALWMAMLWFGPRALVWTTHVLGVGALPAFAFTSFRLWRSAPPVAAPIAVFIVLTLAAWAIGRRLPQFPSVEI
ncbi:MAG: protein kinase [Acidobacteriota bacterium]